MMFIRSISLGTCIRVHTLSISLSLARREISVSRNEESSHLSPHPTFSLYNLYSKLFKTPPISSAEADQRAQFVPQRVDQHRGCKSLSSSFTESQHESNRREAI